MTNEEINQKALSYCKEQREIHGIVGNNARYHGYIAGYNQCLQDIQQQQKSEATQQYIKAVNSQKVGEDHAAEYVPDEEDYGAAEWVEPETE